MTKRNILKDLKKEDSSQLYIAIDHLKEGTYQLNIMNKNTIVAKVKFTK